MRTLTETDQAEIDLFRLYLKACRRWDDANDKLPDFAPIEEIEMVEWQKKRLKAHAAIYVQIYGDKL